MNNTAEQWNHSVLNFRLALVFGKIEIGRVKIKLFSSPEKFQLGLHARGWNEDSYYESNLNYNANKYTKGFWHYGCTYNSYTSRCDKTTLIYKKFLSNLDKK